jgi:FkbM family methyltransferase
MALHRPTNGIFKIMRQTNTILHRSRQPFSLPDKLSELSISRRLTRRGERNVAKGHAPLATFAFDYIGHEVNVRGAFELEELRALFDFLKPMANVFAKGTALDIGANIGNHSVYFAPHFAKVEAFEPNPRTFLLLQANAMLTTNVNTHNLGLGEQDGILMLRYDVGNVGEASLKQSAHNSPGQQETPVTVKRLDDISSDFKDVVFIKIDVEGFEPEVIAGSSAFLNATKPVIVFEQNNAAFVDGRSQTVEALIAMGYRFIKMQKRWAVSGVLPSVVATCVKLVRGMEFEFSVCDTIEPGQYSMVIAVTPQHVDMLSQRS